MKRLFNILMIFALIIGLTACTQTPATTTLITTTKTTTTTETPTTTEEPTTIASTTEQVYNFDGLTVRLAWGWAPRFTEPGEDKDRFDARVAEVEEKLNVNFEWVQVDAGEFWDNMVTNTLAGNSPGTVNFTFPWVFPDWVKAGLPADVNVIAERVGLNMNDKSWDPLARIAGTYGDKLYCFDKFDLEVNGGVIFNKRLIEEAGLVSPYEHVEKGTWNWDTLKDYAKTLTKVDADGKTTQYGLTAMNQQTIADLLILSNGADLVDISSGTPKVVADTQPVLEALSLYQQLVAVDKSVRMGDPDDWENNIKAFAASEVAIMQAEQWVIDYINTMDPEEFGFVYFPKGPNATDYISTAGYFMFWIPANLSEEEQDASLLAYSMIFDNLYPEMTPEEYYSRMGEKYLHDEQGVAIYSDIQINQRFVMMNGDRYGVDNWALYDLLKSLDYTPQAAVAEQKPVMEAKIADFMAK